MVCRMALHLKSAVAADSRFKIELRYSRYDGRFRFRNRAANVSSGNG